MAEDRDRLTMQAAAILRGDLPDLRPGEADELDEALAQALELADLSVGASRVREIANGAHLGARLRAMERDLAGGAVGQGSATRGSDAFSVLPGNPGPEAVNVWTCPVPPAHFRRLQRIPGQKMGVCTQHHDPLIREV